MSIPSYPTNSDPYNGYTIQTETGSYTMCARDFGVEVVCNGELVWSSAGMPKQPSVQDEPGYGSVVMMMSKALQQAYEHIDKLHAGKENKPR